jgi:hypothetical protein
VNPAGLDIVNVIDALPDDFAAMRAEALAEGFRHLERLAEDWASGAIRFDRPGEGLLAAQLAGALAGIGGLTIDPTVKARCACGAFTCAPHSAAAALRPRSPAR